MKPLNCQLNAPMCSIQSKNASGFTLIEVMIVVAIIGILAAIAYPSYQEHVVKSRRATAQGCLVELSQFMERFYTTNMRYDQTSGGAAAALPTTQCVNELTAHYDFRFADDEPTRSTYVLEAVPQGAQAAGDTRCGTLTLSHTGAKGRTGSAELGSCWR